MGRVDADRMILMAVVVAAGAAAVRSARAGEVPPPSIAVGAFIAAMMLSVLARFYPEVAGGLAMVMLVTAVLQPDLANALSRIVGNVPSRGRELASRTGPGGSRGPTII